MDDRISQVYNEALRPAIVALTFVVLFYGIYLALSWTYVSLLFRQRSEEKFKHLFYPISTFVLFLLATAGIILSIFNIGNLIQLLLVNLVDIDPKARETTFVATRTAVGVVYILANFLGDIILVYRCYYVWNGRWLVVITPGILSMVNIALALMSLADIQRGSGEAIASGASFQISFGNSLLYAFRGLNVFNNILLTALIAGRLWYLNNATAKLLGVDPCSDKRSTATISMFLESGSLYPVALICLVFQVRGSPASMNSILVQIVGIAPTLILVRTSLGISIENAPDHRGDAELEEAHLPMQTLQTKRSAFISPASPATSDDAYTAESSTLPSVTYDYPSRHSSLVASPARYESGLSHSTTWNPPSPQSPASAVESERWNEDPFNEPRSPRSAGTPPNIFQPLRRE